MGQKVLRLTQPSDDALFRLETMIQSKPQFSCRFKLSLLLVFPSALYVFLEEFWNWVGLARFRVSPSMAT
jgi:hypothetical protein